MPGRVLIVDDEKGMRLALRSLLAKEGYEVDTAESGEEALTRIEPGSFHVVITDLSLKDIDGMAVLEHTRRVDPDAAVVMITAYGSEKIAVAAMKQRRRRLSAEALRQRRAPRARPPGDGDRAAPARPPTPPRAGPGCVCRADRRAEPRDAPRVRNHRQGRRHGRHRPGSRRERHRQGARRQRAPLHAARGAAGRS